jgi:hypothetical protein
LRYLDPTGNSEFDVVTSGEAARGSVNITSTEASTESAWPKNSLTEYGYWCGEKNAPALNHGLETQIPADPSQWNTWIKENHLPEPWDKVDRACMVHDLTLGKLRSENPNTGFMSVDPGVSSLATSMIF